MEPGTSHARRAGAGLMRGQVSWLASLCCCRSICGASRSSGLLTPPPPIWGGVVLGTIFALVAPAETYLAWRGDRRRRVPLVRRIQKRKRNKWVRCLASLMLLVFALSVGAERRRVLRIRDPRATPPGREKSRRARRTAGLDCRSRTALV